jgi:hypothetical protein
VAKNNKRVLKVLKDQRAKYGGNATLDQVIESENNPLPKRAGRPGTLKELDQDLYMAVEAAKATGMGHRAACIAVAKFARLTLTVVEKRHIKVRKWLARWPRLKEVMIPVPVSLRDPSPFLEFLRTYKTAARTRRI